MYLAAPGRAPTPVVPLASNAPPLPVVATRGAIDTATILVLDANAKANVATQGVPALLHNIRPLLLASRAQPAASRVVSLGKLLDTSTTVVEEEAPMGQDVPTEAADNTESSDDESPWFSVKLGENDTALSYTGDSVTVTTMIEGYRVRVELPPPLARSVLNLLTFNGLAPATPVALKGRSTLVVADGVAEDIINADLPTEATVSNEHPVFDIKRPTMAPPSTGQGNPPLHPPHRELQTVSEEPKVGDQSAICTATTASNGSAPLLPVPVEVSEGRSVRSPSPEVEPEAREEFTTAQAPGASRRGHTGWTPSDGEGSERESRRRKASRRKSKKRPTSPPRKSRRKKSVPAKK